MTLIRIYFLLVISIALSAVDVAVIGIEMVPIGWQLAVRYDLDPMIGIRVRALQAGGLAEKIGIQEGDVVLSVGNQDIRSMSEFRSIMSARRIGDPIEFRVSRRGAEMTLFSNVDKVVDLGSLPEIDASAEDAFRRFAKAKADGWKRMKAKSAQQVDAPEPATEADPALRTPPSPAR